MASPAPLGEPDSRTSSVGRKRGFDHFAASGETVITVDDSSDEDANHIAKRTRHSATPDGDNRSLISNPTAYRDAINLDDSPGSISLQRDEQPATSPEISNHGKKQASGAIPPIVSWNKSIQSGVRTSFGSRVSQVQLPSSLPASTLDHDSEEDVQAFDPELAVEPWFGPRYVSKRKPSDSQLEVAPTPRKALRREKQRPQASTQMEGVQDAQHLSDSKMPGDIAMPRQVSKDAHKFEVNGKSFKLPSRRRGSRSPLSNINFKSSGFVASFLELNDSLLEDIDYKLLCHAFRAYIDLFYGHLPKELTGPVSDTCLERKTITHCNKVIAAAKKNRDGKQLKEPDSIMGQAEGMDNAQGFRENFKTDLVTKGKSTNDASDLDKRRYFPRSSDDQPNEGIAEPQNKEVQSMGRMLGVRRTQSQMATKTEAAEGAGELEEFVEQSKCTPSTDSQEPGTDLASRGAETAATPSNSVKDAPSASAVTEITKAALNASHNSEPEWSRTEIDPIELELLQRYYPVNDNSPFVLHCLTCGRLDHKTSDCPSLTCATCGLNGVHFTDGCPQTQRCTKCREPGHQKPNCPEKLAASSSEGLSCDICMSPNHLEEACHFLWRSFKLESPNHRRLVVDIPIHCYCCGAEGHFGTECGIRRTPLYTEGYTWSKVNWKQYIDSTSNYRAISAGKDYSLPNPKPKRNFAIKGRAQTDSIAISDDSDDMPFIGQKVTKAPRPVLRGNQHIKFNKTRRGNGDNITPPNLLPPIHPPRYQPPPFSRADPGLAEFPKDRRDSSHRPRDDSARHRRERSFSPPPRFQYQPRPGNDQYRPWNQSEDYRRYGRDEVLPSGQDRAQDGWNDNHSFGGERGAQDGRARSERGGKGRGNWKRGSAASNRHR